MDNKFKILRINIKRCIELVGISLLLLFFFHQKPLQRGDQ